MSDIQLIIVFGLGTGLLIGALRVAGIYFHAWLRRRERRRYWAAERDARRELAATRMAYEEAMDEAVIAARMRQLEALRRNGSGTVPH